MSHHELLVRERVALEQVGVGGVVVDDHLVDLRQPILVALRELLVLHPEAPVGIAAWEAPIGRDLVHLVIGQHLEDDWEEVEPISTRDLLDAFLLFPQIARQSGIQRELAHGCRSLPLAEKVFDTPHDGVLVANFAHHDPFVPGEMLAQVLDELSRAVRALHLAVREHIAPRQDMGL